MLAAALAATAAVPLASAPASAADYAWPVVRVIDGDTIVVDASADLPGEIAQLRVRLRGIDAPEIGHRAGCEAERAAGDQAKATAEEFLDAALTVVVRDPEWGKWGGRVVADVILDGKHSLADWVTLGARDWCGDDPSALPAAGLADLTGEIERFIVDPCIKLALDEGMIPPTMLSNYGEDRLSAETKAELAPMVAQLASTLEPYVPQREPEFRVQVYEVFAEFCIMEFRDRIGAGG